MTIRRSDSIDYTTQCTVLVAYHEGGVEKRIVYERPQMRPPNRSLTAAEEMQVLQFPTDDQLTTEAKAIFQDMQSRGAISRSAELSSIFIARSSAAALEMNL